MNNFFAFFEGWKVELNARLDSFFDDLIFNLDHLFEDLKINIGSGSNSDGSGHDWEFVEYVPPVYDELTGLMVSGAYNVYQCLHCGETVNVPVSPLSEPSGSGGSGGSGSGSGSGADNSGDDACRHDWEFVRFVPAVYDEDTDELITAAYNEYQCLNCGETTTIVLDSNPDEVADDLCPEVYSWAERLAAYLSSRWERVVSAVTSFFAALPSYFSDFTQFLTLTFAVFPAEIKSGLVVFILAFLFVGIIKVLRG